MLSALVINSGIQARPSLWSRLDGEDKIITGAAAAFASFALYSGYKIYKSKSEADKATYNASLLEKFLKKIDSTTKCELIGEPGTLEQIEALHIPQDQKTALIAAIDIYDKAVRANASHTTVREAAELLKNRILSHLNPANSILKKYSGYKMNCGFYSFMAGIASLPLTMAYFFNKGYFTPLVRAEL